MSSYFDEHLETVTVQFRIGISPAEVVGGLRNTVTSILWEKCCKFDEVMHGVPILYEKVDVDTGSVTTDYPSGLYRVDAKATALVFRPKFDGTVQHLSLDGVVMSVLGQFTGIIKKSDMPKELELCFRSNYDVNCKIKVQDSVLFTVKDVTCYGDDFCIYGSLV